MPFFSQPHIYFIFLRFWVFVGTVFPHCSHLSGLDFSKMQLFCLFTPNSLQKNKLRVCGSVEMRTHCFLNFCSRFWFIGSLSDIVPGHPHVPCTVYVLVVDLVKCSFVHETNNVMLNKNQKIIAATYILNWFRKVFASLALSTG